MQRLESNPPFFVTFYKKRRKNNEKNSEKLWNDSWNEHCFDNGRCCGESFDPEKARIPKGYVLHKLMHSSGAVNYAYGLELGSEDVFPDYRVLFYLDKRTTKDWDIDIASEF